MEIRGKIQDSVPPEAIFDIGKLVKLIREGDASVKLPERASLDSEWIKEAFPDRIRMGSEALAVWIGTVFRNAGHKVRLVVASDNAELCHATHIYVEVWNPVSCVWVALDPNGEMFPDGWRKHEFLEVT